MNILKYSQWSSICPSVLHCTDLPRLSPVPKVLVSQFGLQDTRLAGLARFHLWIPLAFVAEPDREAEPPRFINHDVQ
jgi:hypothetical protein